jgi:pilus assembly protein Flp/PilA
MTMFLKGLARFVRDDDGPTAVEYAVMLALIVVVCITAITTLGSNAAVTFTNTELNIAAGNSSGGS